MFVPDAPPPPPNNAAHPPIAPRRGGAISPTYHMDVLPPNDRRRQTQPRGRKAPPDAPSRRRCATALPRRSKQHCTPDSLAEEAPYRLMPPPNDDARRRLAAPQGCTRRPPDARNNAAHTLTAPPRRLHIADISRRRRTAPPLRRSSRGRREPVADDPANGPSVAVKTLTARRSVAPRRRPTSEHTNAVPKARGNKSSVVRGDPGWMS